MNVAGKTTKYGVDLITREGRETKCKQWEIGSIGDTDKEMW